MVKIRIYETSLVMNTNAFVDKRKKVPVERKTNNFPTFFLIFFFSWYLAFFSFQTRTIRVTSPRAKFFGYILRPRVV